MCTERALFSASALKDVSLSRVQLELTLNLDLDDDTLPLKATVVARIYFSASRIDDVVAVEAENGSSSEISRQ